MYFKRASQGLLLLSVLFLFNKTLPFFGAKLDVLFLEASTLFLIIAILKKEVLVDWKKIKPLIIASILIIASTLIGSFASFHIFGTIPSSQIITEYKILFGCFLIFFEIIILGTNDNTFLKYLIYTFLFSLIAIVTPYIHNDFLQYIIGARQHRFFGFIGDANYYPTYMMLPTALVFYFLTKDFFKKKNVIRNILLYAVFALTVALTWWSGSRSGWLGVIVEIAFLVIMNARAANKVRNFIGMLIVFISAVAAGYFILPHNAKSDIQVRLGYITTPEQIAIANTPDSETLGGSSPATIGGGISNGDNSIKTIPLIDAVSYNQDRLHIWLQGIHYFLQNPLGYGLVYYNIVNIVSADNHVSVHSFILETLLIGGPLLFLALLYILGAIAYSFYSYKKNNYDMDLETVLFASLLGFLTCSLFLSSLLLRWFWIDLAILITLQLNRGGYDMNFLSFRKKALLDNNNQTREK